MCVNNLLARTWCYADADLCNVTNQGTVLLIIIPSVDACLSTGAVLAAAVQPGERSTSRRFAQGPGRILLRPAAISTRFHGRRCRVLRE